MTRLAENRESMNILGIRTTYYYPESKLCAITKVQDSSIIQAALHIETDICSTLVLNYSVFFFT